MNKSLLFGFALIFLLGSCSDVTKFSGKFNYDSSNFSSPPLPGGTHELAAKFTKDDFEEYQGKELGEIEFYIVQVPTLLELRIYAQGPDSLEPGSLLYQSNLTSNVNENSWNRHLLSTPIDLNDEDIWISLLVSHNSTLPTVGCDPGPAKENGDWILEDGNSDWESFRDNTAGSVDINWNIRAWVLE